MYLIGYDIGSSSVKAALVEVATGQCIASAFYPGSEAPIKAQKAGWAEQSPQRWWDYMKQATRAILKQSGINPGGIKAIGISYQMHGLVVIDRDRNLLRDAIIWCDSRGVPYGEKAFKGIGEQECLSTILNSPGNFTATKLAWVRENEPELFDKIYKIMLPGDYVAMRLTGEITTTVPGLSECMLWDFKNNRVASRLLDYFGIPESVIPDIVPTFGEQGRVTPEAASELGLTAGIPVTYRAGDQPNNALSLKVFNPGEIASTAGTSGVVYGVNGEVSYDPLSRVNNFAHVNHTVETPRLGIMHCVSGTGILNSWVRRNVCPDLSYPEMNELAMTVPIGSDGVSVIGFGNGAERVLRNNDVGCSFHGINFNRHNRAHIVRAAQEGVAFSFQYGIEVMESMGMKVDKIHAGNANMFLSPLFRQALANVSGARIELYDTDGAAGAAKGAGYGAGIYGSLDEAFATLSLISTIEPKESEIEAYREAYSRWKKCLEKEIE